MKPTLASIFLALVSLTAATPASAQSLPASLTNGLVAYYPFNGNANDESGNGHNGTIVGTAVTLTNGVNGAVNSAFRFAPLPDVNNITASGVNLANSSLTVSLWFKKDYSVFGVEHGWLFRLGSASSAGKSMTIAADYGQALRFSLFFDDFDIQSPHVGESKWSHIACTYDNSSRARQIFIDGKLIASNTAQFGFTGDSFLRFNGGGGDKVGLLDQVRFYNRVLTSEEVGQLYQFEKGELPRLSVVVKTIQVRSEVELGKTYQLQASPNLTTWTNFGSSFAATVNAYTNNVDVTSGYLYFRVQEITNP
jgi:trimeric autotransporter adhesin